MSGTTVEITTGDGVKVGPVPIEELEKATDELFDSKPYQKPLPELNGHLADVLKLAFGGNVEIDLMIPDDIEWFKALRFGQELELTITGTVGKSQWQLRTNPETGEEKATHTLGITVHSIGTES